MSTLSKFAPSFGTAVSAALLVLSFPPFEVSSLVWIALVPWFFALARCESLLGAMVQGFWLNLLLGLLGTPWVASTAERYLDLTTTGGVLVWLAHACVHQAQLIVFAAIYWKLLRARPPGRFADLVFVAALYVVVDWATPKVFRDTLGLVLHDYPGLRMLAAFGGTWVLSFVVVLINGCFYAGAGALVHDRASRTLPARRSRAIVPATWALGAIVVFVVLGRFALWQTTQALDAAPRSIRVGIVQGNVSNSRRRAWAQGDADAARETLETYVGGTSALLRRNPPPDLVVWPETAFPGIFRQPESEAQLRLNVAFDRFIASTETPIVFGAYDREPRADRRVLRNAIFVVTPRIDQGAEVLSPMDVYHKSILFPGGEYVPFATAAVVDRWFPNSTHFGRGEGPKVVEVLEPPVRLGPSICYEDLFAAHAIELANAGADLLINVSNDSWFGPTGAPRWHLIMAAMRSVETGLPQVRATNSGYSALILPTGEIRGITPLGQARFEVYEVPRLLPAPTLRMRLGDWFGVACLLYGGGWWLCTRRRSRQSPSAWR